MDGKVDRGGTGNRYYHKINISWINYTHQFLTTTQLSQVTNNDLGWGHFLKIAMFFCWH